MQTNHLDDRVSHILTLAHEIGLWVGICSISMVNLHETGQGKLLQMNGKDEIYVTAEVHLAQVFERSVYPVHRGSCIGSIDPSTLGLNNPASTSVMAEAFHCPKSGRGKAKSIKNLRNRLGGPGFTYTAFAFTIQLESTLMLPRMTLLSFP